MGKSRFLITSLMICLLAFGVGLARLGESQALELKADPNAVFPVETLVAKTGAGEFSFTVEIADEEPERSRGLMFRETMLQTHGMLFVFDELQPVSMWMKNTILPLDMVFVRPDGTVARIEYDTSPQSLKIISSGEPVSHVLELNAGMSRLIGLRPGDRLLHPLFAQ